MFSGCVCSDVCLMVCLYTDVCLVCVYGDVCMCGSGCVVTCVWWFVCTVTCVYVVAGVCNPTNASRTHS